MAKVTENESVDREFRFLTANQFKIRMKTRAQAQLESEQPTENKAEL